VKPRESKHVVRQVALEDLRENVDEYVEAAASGTTIHVTKQGLTVATIAPPTPGGDDYIRPRQRLQDYTPGPRPKLLTVDPAQILIDERERDRDRLTRE
jgi:antitoxin (DNA-binding transcriptional repressor) of toxin-antitoxin stability system